MNTNGRHCTRPSFGSGTSPTDPKWPCSRCRWLSLSEARPLAGHRWVPITRNPAFARLSANGWINRNDFGTPSTRRCRWAPRQFSTSVGSQHHPRHAFSEWRPMCSLTTRCKHWRTRVRRHRRSSLAQNTSPTPWLSSGQPKSAISFWKTGCWMWRVRNWSTARGSRSEE